MKALKTEAYAVVNYNYKLKNGRIVIYGEWIDRNHIDTDKEYLEKKFKPGTHNYSRIAKVEIKEVK